MPKAVYFNLLTALVTIMFYPRFVGLVGGRGVTGLGVQL